MILRIATTSVGREQADYAKAQSRPNLMSFVFGM